MKIYQHIAYALKDIREGTLLQSVVLEKTLNALLAGTAHPHLGGLSVDIFASNNDCITLTGVTDTTPPEEIPIQIKPALTLQLIHVLILTPKLWSSAHSEMQASLHKWLTSEYNV